METDLGKRLVNGLREAGINFVTYLPETRMSQIVSHLQEDHWFKLVPVASEAEAVSIAAGAAVGGKQVACYWTFAKITQKGEYSVMNANGGGT